MHIFHDESGLFVPSEKPQSYSLVCAYALPQSQYEDAKNILREFKTANGFSIEQEVKRKELRGNDAPYFELLNALTEVDGMLNAIGSDVSTNVDIEGHRSSILALPQEIKSNGSPQALLIKKKVAAINALSIQNYTELMCRARLGWEVMQRACGYYAQYRPEELSHFLWEYDYKDTKKSPFEQTLQETIVDFMARYAQSDPLKLIPGADYSAMSNLLKKIHSNGTESASWQVDGDSLVKQLVFVDSERSEGVQIADLLANGLLGILRNQNFEDRTKAASLLGKLMVKRNHYSILPTLRFSDDGDFLRSVEIQELMEVMAASARNVFPEEDHALR